MGNSQPSLVAPRTAAENCAEEGARAAAADAGVQAQEIERPREFHFAVTWAGLFAPLEPAYLDPMEAAAGPRPRSEERAPMLALAPLVAAPPCAEVAARGDPDSGAAWEMVVPKMVRTGPRTFVPAEDGERWQDQSAERRPSP